MEKKNEQKKLTPKEVEVRRQKKAAEREAKKASSGYTPANSSVKDYLSKNASDIASGTAGGMYSAQLSVDFLQKPQNLRERRALWRHFYTFNEFVGAAIDMHSTIPLSRLRLQKPRCQNEKQAEYVHRFFERMCSELKLFNRLAEISHDFWLIGNVFCYTEEHNPYAIDIPEEIQGDAALQKDMQAQHQRNVMEKAKERAEKLYADHKVVDRDPAYKGWERIIILPPDQVLVTKPTFSPDPVLEFMPDDLTRKAMMGFEPGEKGAYTVPSEISDQGEGASSITLNTDPNKGSHCHHMARKKSQYEAMGTSILERCVNTLILNDKLRQAQMMISDRHMTPMRVVTAAEASDDQLEDLRIQVDNALFDPDYSIIANYEIQWNEMGSNGRLLELSTEYEHHESALFAGLGVTRDLLTGESMYSGSKMTLQVLDIHYMLFREVLQNYVEEYLFKPVARKKGFFEIDEFGEEVLIYPKLSFSRLSIKDSDEYFNQVLQLYQKGSISIDVILDILNIDPEATRKKVEADLFTVNDPTFNQLVTGIYGAVSQKIVDGSNIDQLLAKNMGLAVKEAPAGEEGGGDGGMRFAASKEDQETLMKLAKNPQLLKKLSALLEEIDEKNS